MRPQPRTLPWRVPMARQKAIGSPDIRLIRQSVIVPLRLMTGDAFEAVPVNMLPV